MSNKRRVSKKGALVKRKNRIGVSELRHTAIVWHSNLSSRAVIAVNTRTLKEMRFNEYHFHAIENLAHKWSMAMIAVGVEPSGKRNFTNEEVKIGQYEHHKNLIAVFNYNHELLLDKINPNFGKQACWIATLDFQDWDEDSVYRIMEINNVNKA